MVQTKQWDEGPDFQSMCHMGKVFRNNSLTGGEWRTRGNWTRSLVLSNLGPHIRQGLQWTKGGNCLCKPLKSLVSSKQWYFSFEYWWRWRVHDTIVERWGKVICIIPFLFLLLFSAHSQWTDDVTQVYKCTAETLLSSWSGYLAISSFSRRHGCTQSLMGCALGHLHVFSVHCTLTGWIRLLDLP